MNLLLPALILFFLQPANVGEVVIPLTDQPENFSGAAGVYRIEVTAVPTKVRVEEPIAVTVKVQSLQPGPLSHTPRREKLHLFPPEIANNFFIEPLPEEDRFVASENSWEFHWRLMPKHDRVNRIPPLEFIYYQTSTPARFQTADGSRSITLEVKPQTPLYLTAPVGKRQQFREIVEGPSVLHRGMTQQQLIKTVALGLALPPLICFVSYFGWRQLFPEAAERLRRRRGKAFRTAIWRLHRLRQPAASDVRAIIADYLRLRFDLPAGEPTPLEVRQVLQARGMTDAVSCMAENYFRECDAALFAPTSTIRVDHLRATARNLVQDLETAQCASLKR